MGNCVSKKGSRREINYPSNCTPYKLLHVKQQIQNCIWNENRRVNVMIIPKYVNYKIECMPTRSGIRRRVYKIFPEYFASETLLMHHLEIENIDDRMIVWLDAYQIEEIFDPR
jgi:hypothetical protein